MASFTDTPAGLQAGIVFLSVGHALLFSWVGREIFAPQHSLPPPLVSGQKSDTEETNKQKKLKQKEPP